MNGIKTNFKVDQSTNAHVSFTWVIIYITYYHYSIVKVSASHAVNYHRKHDNLKEQHSSVLEGA